MATGPRSVSVDKLRHSGTAVRDGIAVLARIRNGDDPVVGDNHIGRTEPRRTPCTAKGSLGSLG